MQTPAITTAALNSVQSTVWKFGLMDDTRVMLPAGAEVLSVGCQGNDINLWARVDPKAPMAFRRFRVFGTGHPIPPGYLRFVGTAFMHNGGLVWHVFEELSE